jgi:hypothetical protein
MILLTTQYLTAERCIIYMGGEVIVILSNGPLSPEDISRRMNQGRDVPVNFDTVTLVLAFLYAIAAVDGDGDKIYLVNSPLMDITHAN